MVITGTNFTGATAVMFGGTAATSFVVNSATQITAVDPAEAAGTVNVTVTTSAGTSATSASDDFTYVAAASPTVTAVVPNSGPVAGGTSVVITGTNFTGATIGDVRRHGGDQLCRELGHADHGRGSGRGGGDGQRHRDHFGGNLGHSASDDFTYVAAAAPTVTAVNPNSGPVRPAARPSSSPARTSRGPRR